MQEKVKQIFKPDAALIRQHLQFIVDGMKQYAEGRLEISYCDDKGKPNHSANFGIDEVEKAVDFCVEKNAEKRNVYVTGALIDPDTESMTESKRSRDDDFFACNSIWCDIDNKGAPITPEELRKKYIHFPPSLVVVTGRHHNGQPHLRVHLWWKLDEPVTSGDEIRRIVRGIQQTLGGDSAATNECRIMRLGGTVAWPSESKPGRITEMTEVQVPKGAQPVVNAEALIRSYPEKQSSDYINTDQSATEKRYTSTVAGLAPESVDDGRDAYMSDMVYASIVNLAGEYARWPTAQEVYDDVWPVYSRKVHPRDPRRSLDDEGRGSKVLQQKIKSKLRLFHSGRMRGVTLDDLIAQGAKRKSQQGQSQSGQQSQDGGQQSKSENASHGTSGAAPGAEQPKPRTISYMLFDDIKPVVDANDFVQGYFSKQGMSVVYGESNCGKTFFMMDLAFHVALGKRWRNKRVDQGGVVYVALEGSYGLANRLAAFKQENPDITKMPLAMIPSQIDFTNPQGNITEFIEILKELKEKIGSVQLIVVDTLARALLGGDENDGKDMGMLVAHGDKIRAETGAHVCFVHHSGKDKARGARGHSSLRAAVDTEIEVGRDEGAEYSTVRVAKQRDMEASDPAFFTLKTVSLGVNKHNEEVISCIVIPIEEANLPQTKKENQSLSPIQTFVFDAICAAMIESEQPLTVFPGQAPVNCVSYEKLRKTLLKRGFAKMVEKESDTAEKITERVKSVTQSARVALLKKNRIGFNDNYVWLIKDPTSDAASAADTDDASYRVRNPAFQSEFPE